MTQPHALIAAGYRWCERCQEYAFPIDAVWLSAPDRGNLVLVSYVGCQHGTGTTVLNASTVGTDRRCIAMTAAGHRCRNTSAGAGRCRVHSATSREANR